MKMLEFAAIVDAADAAEEAAEEAAVFIAQQKRMQRVAREMGDHNIAHGLKCGEWSELLPRNSAYHLGLMHAYGRGRQQDFQRGILFFQAR
jgi:hypothetical protein